MDYYQGYEDAMGQARASRTSGLVGLVVRMSLSLFYGAFIYVPLLIIAYLLADKLSTYYSSDVYIKIAFTLTLGYFLFATVYFHKGLLIGFKCIGNYLWIPVWAFCVVITCGYQFFLTQELLEDFLEGRLIANYQFWSWLGAGAATLLIYSHYQFLTNVAPRSVFWSYHLGFQISTVIGKKKNGKRNTEQAVMSHKYFENAPMKVSYKR